MHVKRVVIEFSKGIVSVISLLNTLLKISFKNKIWVSPIWYLLQVAGLVLFCPLCTRKCRTYLNLCFFSISITCCLRVKTTSSCSTWYRRWWSTTQRSASALNRPSDILSSTVTRAAAKAKAAVAAKAAAEEAAAEAAKKTELPEAVNLWPVTSARAWLSTWHLSWCSVPASTSWLSRRGVP